MPPICRQTGKVSYVWKDGLFHTAYCVCGAMITVTEDMPRVGVGGRYILLPEHKVVGNGSFGVHIRHRNIMRNGRTASQIY